MYVRFGKVQHLALQSASQTVARQPLFLRLRVSHSVAAAAVVMKSLGVSVLNSKESPFKMVTLGLLYLTSHVSVPSSIAIKRPRFVGIIICWPGCAHACPRSALTAKNAAIFFKLQARVFMRCILSCLCTKKSPRLHVLCTSSQRMHTVHRQMAARVVLREPVVPSY